MVVSFFLRLPLRVLWHIVIPLVVALPFLIAVAGLVVLPLIILLEVILLPTPGVAGDVHVLRQRHAVLQLRPSLDDGLTVRSVVHDAFTRVVLEY